MSAETIYKQMINAGLSRVGACGLMGNMQAESAMKANNAQDGMTRLSDADYTAKFDSDPESCYRDAVGYGLCQWTFYTRKEALKRYADKKGVSVGNEAMQVEFALNEIKNDYPTLWAFLCRTDSLYDAASRVCKEYERPAVNNIAIRASHAQIFYERFGNLELKAEVEKVAEIKTVSVKLEQIRVGVGEKHVKAAQSLLKAAGFDCGEVDGIFGNKTDKATKAFQKKRGLEPDGIIGEQTWAALHEV